MTLTSARSAPAAAPATSWASVSSSVACAGEVTSWRTRAMRRRPCCRCWPPRSACCRCRSTTTRRTTRPDRPISNVFASTSDSYGAIGRSDSAYSSTSPTWRTTLRELVARAREAGLQQLYDALTRDLTEAQRAQLESLLATAETHVDAEVRPQDEVGVEPEAEARSRLERFKVAPHRESPPVLIGLLERL